MTTTTLTLVGIEAKHEDKFKTVLPLSFFDKYGSLSNEDINLLYNKNLLNALIKNPKDDEGNNIVNLSSDEIKELRSLKKALKSKGCYTYCNDSKIGRVYHNSNIQFLPSTLRKTILYDNYFGLDINAAQPNILVNLCRIHNIETKELDYFIKVRDKYLSKYMIANEISRSEAKEKITSIFFVEKCFDPELKKLHTEIQNVTKVLQEIYPNIYKYKSKSKHHNDASFLAILLQTIENRIITMSYYFLKSKGIKTGLILHDELYIRNDKTFEELLVINEELSVYINENFYKFNIKFKLTDFTSEALFGHEQLKSEPSPLTDKQVADAYFEYSKETGSKVIYVSNKCFICDKTSVWRVGNDAFFKSIFDEESFNEYLLINLSNNIKYQTSREWDNLIGYFKKDIRFHQSKTFCFNDKPELLAFNNKQCIILNKLNTKEPYIIRELQPNDYTTMTTNFPLDTAKLVDIQYKEFCKSLITNQFQDLETAETYLTIIGLSLYGELLVKKFFINKGYGDNGRSFFANLIHEVFGDYHGTFNSNFFIGKDFSDGDIKCVESINNMDKRFITINEPNSLNGFKSTSWANEKIKTFTGNDIIASNAKFSNDVVQYKNKATLLHALNTWIKFSNVDGAIKERTVVIPQDTQFVDIVTLPHHKLKLKDSSFLQTDKFKNCMMLVFLDYWSKFVKNNLLLKLSKQIEDYTAELMNDKLDEFIEKYYKKSTSKKDIVVFDDMYNLYLGVVPQGNFPINKTNFKEKVISKKFLINKKDIGKNTEKRVNKLCVLFLERNEIVRIPEDINLIDEDEL